MVLGKEKLCVTYGNRKNIKYEIASERLNSDKRIAVKRFPELSQKIVACAADENEVGVEENKERPEAFEMRSILTWASFTERSIGSLREIEVGNYLLFTKQPLHSQHHIVLNLGGAER